MEQNVVVKGDEHFEEKVRIGVYVCHCGLNIAQTVDCPRVAATASLLDDVTISKDIGYACSEPGQQQIKDDILEHGLDRVVVASCSPRLHEPTFRKMLQSAGINPYLLEMANLREQCSWVHMNEPDAATNKAEDLVRWPYRVFVCSSPLRKIPSPSPNGHWSLEVVWQAFRRPSILRTMDMMWF